MVLQRYNTKAQIGKNVKVLNICKLKHFYQVDDSSETDTNPETDDTFLDDSLKSLTNRAHQK